MKDTMNKSDIAKFHKFLKQDISLKEISAALAVSEKTLKKFTPEIIHDFKNSEAEKRKQILKDAEALKRKATVKELSKVK